MLDLACGDGRNAIYFAERGFRVTGIDFSQVAIARLKAFAAVRNLHIECFEKDLNSEFIQNLRFDSIILSHYKPSPDLLRRAVSWLNPGGTLALCTFNTREHSENGFSLKYCLAPREFIQIDGLELLVYDSFKEVDRHLDGYIFRKNIR